MAPRLTVDELMMLFGMMCQVLWLVTMRRLKWLLRV
jgi:hypothetical protein